MEELKTLFKENISHHAYVVEGEGESIIPELELLLTEVGFNINGNPDYLKRQSENFGVAEVRDIIERDTREKLGKMKVFVLSGVTFTREAQNALLKILEEPQEGSYFFIITNRSYSLLPTLRSRLYEIKGREEPTDTKEAQKFLEKSIPERMSYIQKYTEENDRDGAYKFLRSLEKAIYQKKGVDEKYVSLSEIIKMADYIKDTSSSVKMILEHISIFV